MPKQLAAIGDSVRKARGRNRDICEQSDLEKEKEESQRDKETWAQGTRNGGVFGGFGRHETADPMEDAMFPRNT